MARVAPRSRDADIAPAESSAALAFARAHPDALRRGTVALALAGCAILTVLCRLPFLAVPLTQDEGGYAYVARLWQDGARLYDSAWVDRPQGLMLFFRLMIDLAPRTPEMRLFGAVYAALSALALAYVGWKLYGTLAGLGAAALYALFSSSPQIEGFTVNGELVATLPTVAAVAAVLRAREAARATAWFVVAGCCAGAALLVKQSAIDGAVVVLLCAPLGASLARAERLRRLAGAVMGLALPIGLSVLHGALTGWQRYLDAVVLDNLQYRSTETSSPVLSYAWAGFKHLWAGDAPLIAAAAIGVLAVLYRREPLRWLPLPWLIAAAAGLSLGGLYSRHYFVQALPPLCVLAALGLVWLARRLRQVPEARLLLVALAATVVMAVLSQGPLYAGSSPLQVSQNLYNWPEYNFQDDLVSFVDTHVPPGQPFYVAFASPELHYLTNRPSVTPYLWRRPLGELPGAYDALLRAVNSPSSGPVCIVIVQDVTRDPGDERMRQAILQHYHKVWQLTGVSAYCRSTT